MSAQPVTMQWAGGRTELDDRAAVSLLLDGAAEPVRLALSPDPGLSPVLIEDGVAEHEGTSGGLEVSQRVTVDEHCQLRWVVGVRDQTATAPELEVTLPSGQHGWLWPSGADGMLAVLPASGAGPVLVLHAVQAELRETGQSPDGRTVRLAVTTRGLSAGERQVVILRVVALPELAAAGRLLPTWYEPLTLEVGDEWEAPLADLGVDCEPPVTVTHPDRDDTVRVSAPAGRHRVGIHGRRGVTELTLEVAPPAADLLGPLAEQVLDATSLDSAGSVVVHRALQAGRLPRVSSVEDSLDRFDWSSRGDLLAIAFGSERALLEGEREMAGEAVRQVAALPGQPGLARVRSLVWFAASALGVDTSPLVPRLDGPALAVLEENLQLSRRSETSRAGLAAAINRLGAGLPGQPVGLDLVAQAQLVGLLESCPEQWPEAPLAGFTAQATRHRILARYQAAEVDDVTPLAWLLVSG